MEPFIIVRDLYRRITGGRIPLKRYPFFTETEEGPVIFIHIPKTAGSSIARALSLPPPSPAFGIEKHYPAGAVCRICGAEMWAKAFKFTCVRNPWERLYSHYNYRRASGVTNRKGRDWDFNSWGKAVLGQRKLRNFRPQEEWIRTEPGYEKLDRVIRFERLEDDMKEVGRMIGRPIELPHLLKSGSAPSYTEIYESELREMVSQVYADDIERFGYEFGD